MNEGKKNIRALAEKDLKSTFINLGEKPFRVDQITRWLWKEGVESFSDMTNLSKPLREKLDQEYFIPRIKVALMQQSKDKTIKLAFELHDGKNVEGVLIPSKDRVTACISSQVGCSLDCRFCATGFLKRERNLESYEIYDQAQILNRIAEEQYGKGLTNIVLMGMGEPLLNYKNVMDGIDWINSEEGMHMSMSRITLSTAGIVKMITKMADENVKFNLALSLHASNDEKRSAIMPINDSNSLDQLAEALSYFNEKTGTRPTLEYCVISGVNDSTEDANELAVFSHRFPSKVNLIEYNSIDLAQFESPGQSAIEAFASKLEKQKVIVNIRRSRGKDIDAACGQLANKLEV
jgi:23S rRNA (adenine2503-C2)-methyltransferase